MFDGPSLRRYHADNSNHSFRTILMSSLRATVLSFVCGMTLSLLSLSAWADEQAARSADPFFTLLAQAETGSAPRPEPRLGTVPGAAPKTPSAAHAPVVIPEPPPFPDRGHDDMMTWAIAGVSIMLLLVIFLIVKMVRRDVAKKHRKPVQTKAVNRPHYRQPDFGHTVADNTAVGNTTIGMTQTTTEDEPLTIIQTQWRDIQTNTGSGFPTISLIQADADMQESVKKSGYNPFYGASASTSGIEVIEVGGHNLPEVDALIWMGLNDQAIAVLEQLMVGSEHPAPKVWLMLFDLYARTGAEEKYKKLAQGFKTYFNADVPPWNDRSTNASRGLEDYPAVINKVVRLWGQPTCQAYLDTLLYDNRSGTRMGFSLAAYSSLVFLSDLTQTLKDMDGPVPTGEFKPS